MGGPSSRRRRFPIGLLGALALISGVESFVASRELELTTPSRMEWKLSRRAATERAPGCSALGLGSSLLKLGLYPSVVEEESGLRAYNLAFSAGRIPGSYFLLRRAIEAGARPEAVLLEVHPTYMTVSFQEGVSSWPDLLEPADCLELAWSARDANFFAKTVLARLLPSLNARAEIRAAILARSLDGPRLNRRANLALLRNLDRNAGAFVHRRETQFDGEIPPYLEGIYLPPGWSANRLNERYLRRLLDLCDSRKIRVYWLIPPLIPTLQTLREEAGLDEGYIQFVGRIQEKHPNVVVLDARHAGYENPAFLDAAHLDLPGAVTFSAEVGRILKTSPRTDGLEARWIELPDYRNRTVDAPLEDMAESTRAISGPATVRR